MRRYALVGVLGGLVVGASSALANPPPVKPRATKTKIRVMKITTTHCGGAAPAPDEQLTDEAPLTSQKFLFRRGAKNSRSRVVASAVTDDQGWLAVDLPPGTYCMLDESKRTPPRAPRSGTSSNHNSACLDALAMTCDAVIKAPTVQTVERSVGCFGPCYTGPLPP